MPFNYLFLLPVWGIAEAIRLTEQYFWNKSRPGYASFRFQVGLDGAGPHVPYGHKPLSAAAGDLPDIRLWNEVGDYVGSKMDPGYIRSGTYEDISVHISTPGQPSYVLLTGNDDGVCLAMMTMRWPDQQSFAWTGDWAHVCNHSWYYSNVLMDGKPIKCAWIDKNGNQPVTGIALHLPSFKLEEDQELPSTGPFCAQNPIQTFRYDQEPRDIGVWGQQTDKPDLNSDKFTMAIPMEKPKKPKKPKRRRSTRWPRADRIVRSTKKEHSARELCSSESSHGPDMVSFEEGTFCDMDSRQVYELCTSEESVDCFDVEEQVIRASEAGIMKREEPIQKVYSQVYDW